VIVGPFGLVPFRVGKLAFNQINCLCGERQLGIYQRVDHGPFVQSDQCGKDVRIASKISLLRASMAGLISNRASGRQSVAGGTFLAIAHRGTR